MKVEEHIVKKIGENGVVVLNGYQNTSITFVGASCTASVVPGDRVKSFTLHIEKDDTAVVAVCTVKDLYSGSRHVSTEYGVFLFGVTAKGEILDPFMSKPNCLGQVVDDVGLIVNAAGERFLSPVLVNKYEAGEKMSLLCAKYRNVGTNNANLLCRFLAGKATIEEVKKVAEEIVMEEMESHRLRAELVQMTSRATEAEEERDRLHARLKETQRKMDENSLSATRAQELEADRTRRGIDELQTAILRLQRERNKLCERSLEIIDGDPLNGKRFLITMDARLNMLRTLLKDASENA